jgi:hypothetical protein
VRCLGNSECEIIDPLLFEVNWIEFKRSDLLLFFILRVLALDYQREWDVLWIPRGEDSNIDLDILMEFAHVGVVIM